MYICMIRLLYICMIMSMLMYADLLYSYIYSYISSTTCNNKILFYKQL